MMTELKRNEIIIELLIVANIYRNATYNVREGESLARNRHCSADPINA